MGHGVSNFFCAEVAFLCLKPVSMRKSLLILAILSASWPVIAQDAEFLHRSESLPHLKPAEIIYEGVHFLR